MFSRIAILALALSLCPGLALAKSYRLYMNIEPKDAKVIIWNIKSKFRQGMYLPTGKYDIQVQRAGYQTKRFTLSLKKADRRVSVKLKPKQSRLYVNTVPADAKVVIWNIKPKFRQGMALQPGIYDIQVSAPGYVSERHKNVKLGSRDLHLDIRLEPRSTQRSIFTAQGAEYRSLPGGVKHQPPQIPTSYQAAAPTARFEVPQYALYVNTDPDYARVELLDYHQPYHEGMSLPQGRYQLYISAPGYAPRTETVDIVNQEVFLPVALSPPPRCYAANLRDTRNPSQMIEYTLELQFSGPYVNGAFTRNPLPYGQSERMNLNGRAQGQWLDVIGTYYQNADLLETRGKIYLQDSDAQVTLGGLQVALQSAACP